MGEVALAQSVKRVRNNAAYLRQRMAKRGSQCAVCGFAVASVLHLHHRVPVSKGGTNRIDNVVLLCPNCHALVHEATRRMFVPVTNEQKEKKHSYRRFLRFRDELIAQCGELIADDIFDIAGDSVR